MLSVMLSAISRLVFIALASLTWIFLAVFALRFMGGKQEYAPWTHPLTAETTWVVLKSPKTPPEPGWMDRAAATNPKAFLWVDVTINETGEWQAFAQEALMSAINRYPQQKFFFNVVTQTNISFDGLAKALTDAGLQDRAVILSPFQSNIHELREKLPRFLTGPSTAELAKARFMAGIYLEPLIAIDADVVILDKAAARLTDELKKRHKIILTDSNIQYLD